MLFQIAWAKTNAQSPSSDIGLKKAIGGNFVDIILGIPWWFFIALGLLLLYLSFLLEQKGNNEEG